MIFFKNLQSALLHYLSICSCVYALKQLEANDVQQKISFEKKDALPNESKIVSDGQNNEGFGWGWGESGGGDGYRTTTRKIKTSTLRTTTTICPEPPTCQPCSTTPCPPIFCPPQDPCPTQESCTKLHPSISFSCPAPEVIPPECNSLNFSQTVDSLICADLQTSLHKYYSCNTNADLLNGTCSMSPLCCEDKRKLQYKIISSYDALPRGLDSEGGKCRDLFSQAKSTAVKDYQNNCLCNGPFECERPSGCTNF